MSRNMEDLGGTCQGTCKISGGHAKEHARFRGDMSRNMEDMGGHFKEHGRFRGDMSRNMEDLGGTCQGIWNI